MFQYILRVFINFERQISSTFLRSVASFAYHFYKILHRFLILEVCLILNNSIYHLTFGQEKNSCVMESLLLKKAQICLMNVQNNYSKIVEIAFQSI